jgi:hypothetical protein
MNWLITKHINWRLWNQFFQYAWIKAFQKRYWYSDEEINLDFSEVYANSSYWDYNWLIDFNIKSFREKKYSLNLFQKFLILLHNLIKFFVLKIWWKEKYDRRMYNIETKLQPLYNKFWIYNFRLWYYNFQNSKAKNKFFFWTFESPKYFDEIKDIIQEEFTPKYWILAENVDIYKQIEENESVCVHIRLWDFLRNDNKEKHYVCTTEYFKKSLEKIKTLIKNPKFFVFSDNINRVKENLDFPEWTYYEKWNLPIRETLRLMYSCKHFIISNSTFSRWAQYLSKNPNKIVIAPSKWWNKYSYLPEWKKLDIYMDNWTLIDVD